MGDEIQGIKNTMKPKIIIIGDTHGNFEIIEKIFRKENTERQVIAILHAGDIGVYDDKSIIEADEISGIYSGRLPAREIKLLLRHKDPVDQFIPYLNGEKEFPVPFYNIPGNHEDFELYSDLLSGKLTIKNFIPMNPDKIYNIQLGKQKLKIAGLGKIFPQHGSNRVGPQYIKEIEISQIKKALNKQIDIFLLHEPPYLVRESGSFGNPRITKLIRDFRPKYTYVGHMHFEYSINLGQSKIYGLGYGVIGRYAIINSDLSVEFKSINNEPIEIKELKEGSEEITKYAKEWVKNSKK
ncbi:MAG: metallophosphoesterase [Leptospiraceae bacterium]|nr:metallophosphoesterase [Leptospiraceae bacterium]